jgi:signal transduction histidine kinase
MKIEDSGRSRTRHVSGTLVVAPLASAIVCAGALILMIEFLWPAHASNLAGRAGVETTILIAGLTGIGLLAAGVERSGLVRDVRLLGAVAALTLTEFAFSVLPALSGVTMVTDGPQAHLTGQALVAGAFLTAAVATPLASARVRWPLAKVALIAVGTVVVAMVAGSLLSGGQSLNAVGPLAVGGCATFVAAGLVFISRSTRAAEVRTLLGGACFLLAAAALHGLSASAVPADWITSREALRLFAFGLILAAAVRQYAAMRHAAVEVALLDERKRIARDLHDGLAQDLAFIASQSEKLAADYGGEHPLTIAARRALAASRGAIVDLAASSAPTTEAALRRVADELTRRFAIPITVRVGPGDPSTADLDPVRREEVVRIAREAIVNAIHHGDASHVEVELRPSGDQFLLRVTDDGSGLEDRAQGDARQSGLGMATMHGRARAIGARLVARSRQDGGTDVDVVVS